MKRFLAIPAALTLVACASTGSNPPAPAEALPPAVAAASTPSEPLPPYGPERPLPAPEIDQRTLANGLTVWVVPRDGLPRVDTLFVLKGGLATDQPDNPGLSGLIATLLPEGTATRSSRQIAEAFQAIGGEIGGTSDLDSLRLAAHGLASNAPRLIELLADVARTASFPEKEVSLAKANALEQLKANEARAGYLAARAFDHTVLGAHPYGHSYPSAASIQAVTRALVKSEYRRRLRPERALLIVTGRIAAKDAFALAQKYFGDWHATGKAAVLPAVAPQPTAHTRVLVARPGSVQSSLRVGRLAVAATDADRVPVSLTATVLGGYFGSRLNKNLREDKGYTYGAFTRPVLLRVGGVMVSSTDVRNDVTGAALGETLKEFDALARAPVSDDELQRVKRYRAGLYLFRNQLQGAVAGTLADSWTVGLPADDLVTFIPRLQAVTAEQVQQMAKKYFTAGDQTVVVVGDPAAVSAQLAPYGTFETVAP